MFVINHTYKEIGLYPKDIVSGGTGSYLASNDIWIIGRQQKKEGTETVGYNFINCDVQGYEAEVFKGATETLKHIDYIYCEVNKDECYKGCAKVEELDALLVGFKRVETGDWVNDSWTDALYIKK